ncbi:MAG: efflux RND transporter periplasmic adaptor subunit [Acidobacteriota bacterium]
MWRTSVHGGFESLFKTVLLGGSLVACLGGCGGKSAVSLPPPEVRVAPVIQRDAPLYAEFVGQINGATDIQIRARVDGFLEGIHFKEGSLVKAGELLYTIDPREYQAQVDSVRAQLAEAKTQLTNAQSELARVRPLAEMNALSKRDLDSATAKRDAALGEVDAAKAQVDYALLNLSYCRITAPISGLIGKTQAKVGDYVGRAPNPVILNLLSDVDTVDVDFFISETDYLAYVRRYGPFGRDQKEPAPMELILADGSVFPQKGTANFADSQVDPSTGSLLIQASFPNPDRVLRTGQFARIRMQTDIRKGALLVPQRAVQELQGLSQLYVMGPGDKVQLRTVQMGPKVGNLWMVNQGLSPGDTIVVEGIQKLKPDMAVVPKPYEASEAAPATTAPSQNSKS